MHKRLIDHLFRLFCRLQTPHHSLHKSVRPWNSLETDVLFTTQVFRRQSRRGNQRQNEGHTISQESKKLWGCLQFQSRSTRGAWREVHLEMMRLLYFCFRTRTLQLASYVWFIQLMSDFFPEFKSELRYLVICRQQEFHLCSTVVHVGFLVVRVCLDLFVVWFAWEGIYMSSVNSGTSLWSFVWVFMCACVCVFVGSNWILVWTFNIEIHTRTRHDTSRALPERMIDTRLRLKWMLCRQARGVFKVKELWSKMKVIYCTHHDHERDMIHHFHFGQLIKERFSSAD